LSQMRKLGFKFQLLPRMGGFKFTVPLNASIVYFSPIHVTCEKVEVCTVHWGQHWKANWVDVFMLYSSESGLDHSAWNLIAVCTALLWDPLKGDWNSE
jgi:hypothetical protein